MKPSCFLLSHKRCLSRLTNSVYVSASSQQNCNRSPDQTKCTRKNVYANLCRESIITHQRCVETNCTNSQLVVRKSRESTIQRIRPSQQAQSQYWHQWTLRSKLPIILSLLLLSVSQRVTVAVASQSMFHQNHSRQASLPSQSSLSPAQLLASSLFATATSSSFRSSSTLLLEELLQEQSLENAIYKLTNAWNRAHGEKEKENNLPSNGLTSDPMISSMQVKMSQLSNEASDRQSGRTVEHTRKRRWAKPQNAGPSDYSHTTYNLLRANDMVENNKSRGTLSKETPQQESVQGKKSTRAQEMSPPLVTANCTRCRHKDEARSLRIETIKFNILNRLGWESPPNVSGKLIPDAPPVQQALEHYSRIHGDISRPYRMGNFHQKRFADNHFSPMHHDSNQFADEFFVNVQKSYIFAKPPPSEKLVFGNHRVQYFTFPANVVNSRLQHATLWLYLNGSQSNPVNSDGHIHIYKVVRGEPSLATTTKSNWIKINITSLVAEWFHRPEDNLGLAIHSHESLHGTELPIIHYEDASLESAKKPFIEVKVSSAFSESGRRKRMTSMTCDDKSSEVRCCRYPLTIDFESFGWDWVIAPKRYEANYCSGECGLILMNNSPHTHLIQQSNFFNPTGPCCSPRKMSPISMLYMDNNFNIIYGILPNMVVEKCDCS